jgi:hypothetical protein
MTLPNPDGLRGHLPIARGHLEMDRRDTAQSFMGPAGPFSFSGTKLVVAESGWAPPTGPSSLARLTR